MTRLYGVLIVSFPQQPDMIPRTYSLTRAVTSIGRTPAASIDQTEGYQNHIEIDIAGVAEQHALVLCDDDGIRVAVIGGQHGEWRSWEHDTTATLPLTPDHELIRTIAAGESVILVQGDRLTIGPIELGVRPAPGIASPDTIVQTVDPLLTVALPLLGDQPQHDYVVTPGRTLTIPLTITNRAEQIRKILVAIDNPPLWDNNVAPDDINLDRVGDTSGREQAVVSLIINVPRSAKVPVAVYPLRISITATSDPYITLTKDIRVRVLPFVAFEAQLRPEHVITRRRGRFDLILTNSSNWRLPLLLDVRDSQDALRWRVRGGLQFAWRVWSSQATRLGWRIRRTLSRILPTKLYPTHIEQTDPFAMEESWVLPQSPAGQPLNLEPGETRHVDMRIWPKGWRPLGAVLRYDTHISVTPRVTEATDHQLIQQRTSNAGLRTVLELVQQADPSVASRELKGELSHRPLPTWLPVAIIGLVVLCLLVRFPQLPQSVLHRIQQRQIQQVHLGRITTAIEMQGVIVPQQMQTLAFQIDGRFGRFNLPEGCSATNPIACKVSDKDLIALLQDTDAEQAKDLAQDQVDAAQTAQTQAQRQQVRNTDQANEKVQLALDALFRLDRGGKDDVFAAAEDQLSQSSDQYILASDTYSVEQQLADTKRLQAIQAVQEAQQHYTKAKYDKEWVDAHGSHPTEQIEISPGVFENRKLTDIERQAFTDAAITASRAMVDATQVLTDTQKTYNLTIKQGDAKVKAAASTFDLAQRALNDLCPAAYKLNPRDDTGMNTWIARCHTQEIKGKDGVCDPMIINKPEPPKLLEGCRNKAITDAYAAVVSARRDLEAVQDASAADAGGGNAVEAAQRAVADAQRRMDNSNLTATASGFLVPVALNPGEEVKAGQPVAYLITTGTRLEVAAELPEGASSQLYTDLPVTVTFVLPITVTSVTKTSKDLLGTVRILPPPAVAGVPMSAAERAVRIALPKIPAIPIGGQPAIPLYTPVTVHANVALNTSTPTVYWLPPSMVATTSQGSYVIVRQGWLDYRVPVEVGAKTERQVEIRSLAAQSLPAPPMPTFPRLTLNPSAWLRIGQDWLVWGYHLIIGSGPTVRLAPNTLVVAP